MAATRTFTVDAIGDPEPITVQSTDGTRKVVVFENGQAGTTDFYLIKGPDKTVTQVLKPAGVKVEFERPSHEAKYRQGEVVGWLATVSGSATFAQEED